MKFVDEYRDPIAARHLVARIDDLAGDGHYKFMEVCGGHTHTIYRHGIEHVLPHSVELVHGPGCPVCVIPMGRVDDGIAIAHQPGDWVLIHVGFALSKVDEEEAEATLRLLEGMGADYEQELAELRASVIE